MIVVDYILKEVKRRDKNSWKIQAILVVFVIIGSCMAMPSAGEVSESGKKQEEKLWVSLIF